jgi:imidazolonepropionase-like amidohydrolase
MIMSTTIIHAKVALPGVGQEIINDATLVVVDGIIQMIEPRQTVSLPTETNHVYNFKDQYLLPGLIDAHVHLIFPGDGRPADQYVQARSDMELLLTAERNAEQALAAGVTTMRDVGSRGRIGMVLRDAVSAGLARGSRLVVSGPAITITGGHAHCLCGEADGIDGVRQKARAILKEGADLIKIMGSGGGTPGTFYWKPSYTVPEIQAAAEEAHRCEKHITVHADCIEAVEIAVAAGVDMIEHAGMWTVPSKGPKHEYQPQITENLVKQGIYVGPTLQALNGVIRHLRQLAQERKLTKFEQTRLDNNLYFLENQIEDFRRMRVAGVKLVASTDAGWDINPFGSDYVTGLDLAAEAGMPSWEIIEHATSRAAKAIGLENQVGILAPGYKADLMLVADNPLTNITTLRKPTAVFQNGQLVIHDIL